MTERSHNEDLFELAAQQLLRELDAEPALDDLDKLEVDPDYQASREDVDQLWDAFELIRDDEFPELTAFEARQAGGDASGEQISAESAADTVNTLNTVAGSVTDVSSQSESANEEAANQSRWQRWAVAVLLAFCMPFVYLDYQGSAEHLQVAKGEQLVETLDDGSEILLASGSEAVIRESWSRREVILKRGTAFFDVAPNKDKPFSVIMDGVSIEVLGTAFSVYRKADSVEVVVEEGRVQVDRDADSKDADNNREQVRLGHNDKLIITPDIPFAITNDVNIEEELAWREGLIYFKQRRLDEVISRMGDYYHAPIYLMNKDLSDLKVSGAFRVDDVSGFLSALEKTLGIRVEHSASASIIIH